MEHEYDVNELLRVIDPSACGYNEWLNVGMALHAGGYSVALWDAWSARDYPRYKSGECTKKWRGFGAYTGSTVTMGTVVQMARDNGWQPPAPDAYALDWNAAIGEKQDHVIVDRNWVEGEEVIPPSDWDPIQQLTTYLETLFEASEIVGYVTECYDKEGRWLPTRGSYDRTAGQLIEKLSKCRGDITNVIGTCNPQAGAWIRFNPLDGQGVRNENVTEYRYALAESDKMDIEHQNAILRQLELPIACLVHSGKRSLHAIVKVDASNYQEYQKRVDYLYDVCKKNGLEIDRQNRNPSRLSRMPGIMRNGQKQYLVDTNIGKSNWVEWQDWIESVNDDLPDPESIADVWDSMPALADPLIDGVLRQGHKMLLAGPSKAGKSFALIELCCAIAEGRQWLGWQCAQGRVLYVNLELDRASCLHRFRDVYAALGWQPRSIGYIDVWNLRGRAIPMDKLAPKLIRRATKKRYIAIVIDPIYKVITGDENSADQMATFCNQFDRICTELNAAVIYCHHHSKGQQGQKRSMDRASGSGVFARDPDVLLDLIELDVNDDARKQIKNNAACDAIRTALNACARADWEDRVGQDEMCSAVRFLSAANKLLTGKDYAQLVESIKQAQTAAEARTAWRIDGTLREFPKFAPVNMWFDYPVHHVDASSMLADLSPDCEQPWRGTWKQNFKNKRSASDAAEDRKKSLDASYSVCNIDGHVTVTELAEAMGIAEKTVRRRITEHGNYTVQNGEVIKR